MIASNSEQCLVRSSKERPRTLSTFRKVWCAYIRNVAARYQVNWRRAATVVFIT